MDEDEDVYEYEYEYDDEGYWAIEESFPKTSKSVVQVSEKSTC